MVCKARATKQHGRSHKKKRRKPKMNEKEIDKKIATGVMGWIEDQASWVYKDGDTYRCSYHLKGSHAWQPSTNIAQAFEVVEKMHSAGWSFKLRHFSVGGWVAGFGTRVDAAADTPAMAICKAALEAVKDANKTGGG